MLGAERLVWRIADCKRIFEGVQLDTYLQYSEFEIRFNEQLEEVLNMGAALYPEFDKAIPGITPSLAISGKALARAAYDETSSFNQTYKRLSVGKLIDFYAESMKEAFEKTGDAVPEGMDPEKGLEWFEPKTLLVTLKKILQDDNSFEHNMPLYQDINDLSKILSVALIYGCKFRLRIDI